MLPNHSEENTTHHLQERLASLQNRVEDLLERQRLSRFDTLMFLAYPVVIAGITTFASVLWQYKTLSAVMIGRLTLTYVIALIGLAFFLWVVWGFIRFVRAYPTDSLTNRIRVFSHFVSSSYSAITVIFIVFADGLVADLIGKESSMLTEIFLLTFSISTLTFLSLSHEQLSSGATYKVALWFRKNMPRLYEESGPSLDNLENWVQSAKRRGRFAEVIWFVLSLPSYAIMIALAVRAGGLQGTTAFHYWTLVALVAMSVVLVLRSSKMGMPQTIR
jgi:hypothetical protein